MNVIKTLVRFVREDTDSLFESHVHPHTGLVDEPEIAVEIEERRAAIQLAEAALRVLGLE